MMAKTKQGVRDLNNLGAAKKHRSVSQEELAEVFCNHKFECQVIGEGFGGRAIWADVCENCGTQDECHHQDEDDNRDGNPG